jgi:hypothetical protein
MMQAPLEPTVATGVDQDDLDGATGAEGGTDQRRATMAGDMEAGAGAGLDIQVLGHAAGDVGRPAHVAARMRQRLAEVKDVHAVGGGQFGERDHATASVTAQASATVGQAPHRASMARARRPRSVSQ